MDCFFEIVYVETEDMICQLYTKALNKRRSFWTIVMLVFAAIFAHLAKVLDNQWYAVGAVIYVLLAVWYFFLPQRAAKKGFKEKLKYYGGENPPITVRFAENMTISDIDSFASIPYEKFDHVYVLKDCIAIDVAKKWYCVPMVGFTKGNASELIHFLRERCPQLKLPGWLK